MSRLLVGCFSTLALVGTCGDPHYGAAIDNRSADALVVRITLPRWDAAFVVPPRTRGSIFSTSGEPQGGEIVVMTQECAVLGRFPVDARLLMVRITERREAFIERDTSLSDVVEELPETAACR